MNIQDLRATYPGYSDDEIIAGLRATKYHNYSAAEIGKAIGYEPPGGFVASAKSAYGAAVKGAGQLAADVVPGVGQDNALKRYGQGVIEANPTGIHSLEDAAESPWKTVKEATGNAAGSIGQMVGARLIGQGITAASPLAGPLAPAVAILGQAVAFFGPAAVAALPSYGGIRDKQVLNDPQAEESWKSKAVAALGAATVGAIETKFGPQQWALGALTKEGRATLAKKFAETTLAKSVGFGVLKGGLIEGAEELVQNPIEQLASFDDPRTPENVKETIFGGLMGAIGGGVVGGGFGAAGGALRPGRQPEAAQRGLIGYNPSPSPLVSFPDGSVGTAEDADLYVEKQREDRRAEIKARVAEREAANASAVAEILDPETSLNQAILAAMAAPPRPQEAPTTPGPMFAPTHERLMASIGADADVARAEQLKLAQMDQMPADVADQNELAGAVQRAGTLDGESPMAAAIRGMREKRDAAAAPADPATPAPEPTYREVPYEAGQRRTTLEGAKAQMVPGGEVVMVVRPSGKTDYLALPPEQAESKPGDILYASKFAAMVRARRDGGEVVQLRGGFAVRPVAQATEAQVAETTAPDAVPAATEAAVVPGALATALPDQRPGDVLDSAAGTERQGVADDSAAGRSEAAADALTEGQRVTLGGKSYTVSAVAPSAVTLADSAGNTRMIEAGSKTYGQIQQERDLSTADPRREPTSWVIREKATGKVVMETFDRAKVNALNTAKYEAVPVMTYLQGINKEANRAVEAARPQAQAAATEAPAPTVPATPAPAVATGAAVEAVGLSKQTAPKVAPQAQAGTPAEVAVDSRPTPAAPTQDFVHAGLEIKRTSTREADGTSGDRWVIQTPENADRKARGERQIGGDRLVNSIDQAKQVAEEMRQQAETDASRAAKFDRQDSEQKAADDARKAKNKGKTIADIRAASALDKMVRDDGQAITRRAWVEKRIAAGDVAKVEQEDKIKPMTRQQFNRASNEEQRAHDRRIQEAGKKDAYWLGNYEVTKAEYDYAELLSASAPVVAAVGTPAVAPAAPAPDVQPSDNLAAAGQAQPAVDAETAATAPAATISPTPEKPKRPIAAQRAADTRASALADYFATGNVVKSYGGFDEVLALKQSEDGSFSVKVHSVTKDQSGQWVRQGKPQDARWHSTSPDANELKAGPVAGSLPHMRGDLVGYTEGRADGQPFKNAPDRGIAPSVKAALPDAKPAPVEDRPAPSKAKPATKADALTQTFDQWAQATLDASEYEGVYRESAGGNEKLAGLMAVNGDPDGDPKQMLAQARSQYWRDIMSSPREASLSLDVLESLPSAQQYDAQRHFYDLDGRIAGKTQDETKAQVKAEGEKRKPYEDALAEVEAEIKRLDARNGPITAKQNELSARSDRLREAIYQIGRGNTPDGRLLKKTNAGPAAQAEIAAPYTALEGRMIEQPIEAEGASVVRRRDAAKALRKLDEREAGLKSLLKCLKGGG